jgi:hypothetical protein
LSVTGAHSALRAPGEEISMTDEPATHSAPAPPPPRRRAARPPAPAVAAPEGRLDLPAEAPAGVTTGVTAAPAPPDPAPRVAVELARGAVGGIRAQDVHLRTGVVGGIAAGQASLERGLVGGIAAREAHVTQSVVRVVVAQEVHVEQSFVRAVVANHVEAGPATVIGFAVARRVDGEARILFDWRGALALAAVFGALAALFRLRRR